MLSSKLADSEARSAVLETEVAHLKDQLHEAALTVKKLEKQVNVFTHIDLDETAIKVLIRLAQSSFEHEHTLERELNISPALLTLCLGELVSHDYVCTARPTLIVNDGNEALRVLCEAK